MSKLGRLKVNQEKPNYVEIQANDMRDMLKAAMMPKLTIEDLM